ncbi:hypothetical protein PENSPDRAFT_355075 [Peniophora sp. CONT]|nr:hypothetical protein PENSPDRAFT_355075 [Peniophora sp. CONT]
MSSRADSASPPPYSYKSSSFAPPPPRAGEISRSWDFQMKFEAAHEDVRWALRAPQLINAALPNLYVSQWIRSLLGGYQERASPGCTLRATTSRMRTTRLRMISKLPSTISSRIT